MEAMPEGLQRLRGKVAIVTGASRGIGRATALALASEGASVVVNYANSKESAEQVVADVASMGSQAIALSADVSQADQVEGLIAAVLEKFGRVDVLVNNAGITRDTLLLRMKLEDWQAVIDLNLTGVFLCTRAVSKIMLKQKSGRMINITSVAGQVGNRTTRRSGGDDSFFSRRSRCCLYHRASHERGWRHGDGVRVPLK